MLMGRHLPKLLSLLAIIVVSALVVCYRRKLIDGNELQAIFSVVVGLFAAYFGARAAMKFQISREDAKDKQAGLDTINSIIFSLLRRVSFLKSIREQLLEPSRSLPLRHLQLLSAVAHPPKDQINVSEALRIFGKSKIAAISDLELADNEFWLMLRILDVRSDIHHSAQKSLSAAGVQQPFMGNHAVLEDAVGRDAWIQLTDLTNQIYILVPECESHTRAAIASLIEVGKKQFPDGIFEISFTDQGP